MLSYILTCFRENWSTVVLLVVVFLCALWLLKRPANLPLGPLAVPLIGSLPLLLGNPEKIFPNLRKKYGDIFCFYAGSKPMIVISGIGPLREALIKFGHATSNRPSSFLTDMISERKGLLSSQGHLWKEQRTFTVSKLRSFGMGKVSLEGRVLEEVQDFIDYMKTFSGKAVQLQDHLFNSVSNVILSVVVGKRYEYDDPDFLAFRGAIAENFKLVTSSNLVNIFPWLYYLPGDFFNMRTIMKNVQAIRTFARRHMEEHRKEFNSEIIRDFIDAYLIEMESEKSNPDTTYSNDQFEALIADLCVAGSETTATTLNWGILFLALNPRVQEKVQKEIGDVVGSQRYASLLDKVRLPYTEATMMEIQRMGNIGFFLPPHCTSEDIRFHGYSIPRGTTLLLMIGNLMFDDELWEDVNAFRPERFLVDGKVDHPEKFIPFSVGRRACPGEALAKMELFLFLTALMQNFTFKFPAGLPTPTTERVFGFTVNPHPYKICAVPRET